MRLRQFTPRQLIPDIPITPCEWQPDPEVIIKQDDLHARAWECEYDKPIFDSDRDNLVTTNSSEITVRSEKAADETRSTPGTIRESSPEIIPQVDRSYDGTDTDHYMQPDADTSVGQIDPTPTNPRCSKYDLRLTQGQIVMTITDTKSQVYFGVHPEQLRIQHVDFEKVLREASRVLTRFPTALLISFLQRHQTATNLVVKILKLQKSKHHVPEIPTYAL